MERIIRHVSEDAGDAPEGRANVERRDEQTRCGPGAESEDHLDEAEETRNREELHEFHRQDIVPFFVTDVQHEFVPAHGQILAVVEKRPDRHVREHPGPQQMVARNGCDETDDAHLEDDVAPFAEPCSRGTVLRHKDVVVYEERADAAANDTKDDEDGVLGPKRRAVVWLVEHRQFSRTCRVPPCQRHGRDAGSEERTEHRPRREYGARLFVREEHAAKRRAESDRHAGRARTTEELSLLRFVLAVAPDES
mmetsp:Transcript_19770/g.54452  ORF Transcript_19770/g.54452 Transcript_19770/m.54452 type:complete len:251 (-) Transcript_19770:734-1486(-)